MPEQSVYQVADWNGQNGERWVTNQVRLDHMLAAFGEAAIAAAAPAAGERVLDVGCGAGASSFELAARVGPSGQVKGVDISKPLIDRARANAPANAAASAAVSFELADAAHTPLPAQAYDLIFSRFGVMFFEDPAAAFAHLRTALKPGGRLAFVCWRGPAENDWVRLPMGAIRDLIPPAPAPDPEAPGPFSFGDRDRVARILDAAGFADAVIAPFDDPVPFGLGDSRAAAVEDALEMAFEVGPLSRALDSQPAPVLAQASEAVRRAFAARPGDKSVLIDGAAWIVTARNPG